VTRYLLDTNIISDAIKPEPTPAIAEWMLARDDTEIYISTITIGEIWRGILRLPDGRRRAQLETWLLGEKGPQALFRNRILAYDEAAAIEWARTMAAEAGHGRMRKAIDTMIAAIAIVNRCVVVTTNERDLQGLVELINPARRAE
jgi:toxin FitB